MEESFEEKDDGGKGSDIGGRGAGFERGKVDVPRWITTRMYS